MGILLRFYVVTELPFNYKFLLHAHSHTALLGWIYLGLTTLIYKIFLQEAKKPILYKRIFYFTNFCIVGMIITFPIQGYALFSIIFSTLFLFASYWFAWFAMKFVPQHFKKRISWRLVKTSLWYLVISSVGPWAIGAVMATLGPTSVWYKTSIYIYLHFQYNGWFILSLLGMIFYFFEEKGVVFNPNKFRSFFLLLNLGIIFTVFLSILWFQPPVIFYVLGAIGALAQILAFQEIYNLLKNEIKILKREVGNQSWLLLKIAGVLLVIKLLMQLISAHPYMADLAFRLKDFVIGYLHLVFLGVVIPTLLVFLKHFKLIRLPKMFVWLYLLAFATTELLIFYKAVALWIGLPFFSLYYILLALISCIFPVTIAILFFGNTRNIRISSETKISH